MKIQKSAIFEEKSLKINLVRINNIIKIKVIVILQVNIEVLHLAYVIQNIVYLKKCSYFFTMDQAIIIILS